MQHGIEDLHQSTVRRNPHSNRTEEQASMHYRTHTQKHSYMVAQSISVAKITADIMSIVHFEAQCTKKSKYTQKTKHNSHN